jgi:hypothetical protein
MGNLPIVAGYILRVFLGAILGLIIGYVNVTSTPAAGLAASPLLLSLVAGFATDAVLSLLDRIALAISYDRNVNAKNTPTPAPGPLPAARPAPAPTLAPAPAPGPAPTPEPAPSAAPAASPAGAAPHTT